MGETVRLFASRYARTQADSKSVAKLEIPILLAWPTFARRIGDCGRRGSVAACQLEQKLRARRHALARTHAFASIYERDRRRGVPDPDQENCARTVEVGV